ncbi:Lipase, secreted [Lecanosticta acicola]|uniref:Lipase, secreted, partial n=1 Tax=Lecanosticta acicola TaxID=111012 RepID=A0AAI9E6Z2_9PEZI|nr:Lipase, secreted [Lecanosticta acicola]
MLSLLRLLAFLPLAFSDPTSHLEQRQIPTTPDNDPFYDPPPGFESEAPGAILKTRTITASFLGIIPAANVETYQLLYRTTAINGSAIAGVTTVSKPLFNPLPDRFVSFHTAYDASAKICDPSHNYQLFAPQADLLSEIEVLILEIYLAAGYIVSSPDYEGPDAAFGAERLAGIVALDSMRAVSHFHETLGMTTSTPSIVGYGYSGGAIATGWAAGLQPTYAPELPMRGWAFGGTPANLTGTIVFVDNTAFSGFLPFGVVGISTPSAYGAQLTPLFDEILTPYAQSKVAFARTHCTIADVFNFFEQSILSPQFSSLGDRLLYHPTVSDVLVLQTMGVRRDETPTAPVYMYHSAVDEIIPYANASTLYDSWCSFGASVDFVTFGNGGHVGTEILGLIGAFDFVQSAFAGTVAMDGCKASTTLDNTLDPIALGVDLEPVLLRLTNMLAHLGENDENMLGILRSGTRLF